jgi:hypothetical protein
MHPSDEQMAAGGLDLGQAFGALASVLVSTPRFAEKNGAAVAEPEEQVDA